MRHKKRIAFFLAFWLFPFLFPSEAAIDVKLKGSIFSEMTALPGDVFTAGHRTRLYTELERTNDSGHSVFARIWFINQKAGTLTRYDTANTVYTENLVDWAEIKLTGKLTTRGPAVNLSIGNFELDYSPYIISLRDTATDEYGAKNKEYRGVAMKALDLFGLSFDGFTLWGFEKNSSKNMMGASIAKSLPNTKINFILYDYSDRTEETKELVQRAKGGEIVGSSKLIWEQMVAMRFEQKLGKLGVVDWLVATQEQVQNAYSKAVLKNAELKIPLTDSDEMVLGYRDVPADYDPLLRDRTPKFDEATGYYLGYNPVDLYRDRVGFYLGLSIEKPSYSAKVLISSLKEHGANANYLTNELSLSSAYGSLVWDLYSFIEQKQRWFDTQVSNLSADMFFRLAVKKRVPVKIGTVIPGIQLRYQDNLELYNSGLLLFMQYEIRNLITTEAGIRYKLSGESVGGRYWFGLNYRTPLGLTLNYRYTFIPEGAKALIPNDGRYYYDPDYSPLEQDNILQLSVNIEF